MDQGPRRVSDLRVTVRDMAALASIRPEQLVAYLDRRRIGERSERLLDGALLGYDVKIPRAGGPGALEWIFVPQRADYADYTARVSECVRDLAEAEERSELAVLLELLGVAEPLPLLPD